MALCIPYGAPFWVRQLGLPTDKFSGMPSTDGIMHPIFEIRLSPITKPFQGCKQAPPSNAKPSASNACPLQSVLSLSCPQQMASRAPFESGNPSISTLTHSSLFSRVPSTDRIMHPIWGGLLSPATRPFHAYPQSTQNLPPPTQPPKQLKTFRLRCACLIHVNSHA